LDIVFSVNGGRGKRHERKVGETGLCRNDIAVEKRAGPPRACPMKEDEVKESPPSVRGERERKRDEEKLAASFGVQEEGGNRNETSRRLRARWAHHLIKLKRKECVCEKGKV